MDTYSEKEWIEALDLTRKGKSKAFDQQLLRAFQKVHKKALIPLVGSAEESWQVYLQAMTKFWEKYILAGNELPAKNINGYIFMMCKNAYYDRHRKKKKEINTESLSLDDRYQQAEKSSWQESYTDLDTVIQDRQYLLQLHQAIERLGDSCKAIIEENVLGKIKLIELRKKLQYGGGYQAIVQKKKRCLKKLTKFFFEELHKG